MNKKWATKRLTINLASSESEKLEKYCSIQECNLESQNSDSLVEFIGSQGSETHAGGLFKHPLRDKAQEADTNTLIGIEEIVDEIKNSTTSNILKNQQKLPTLYPTQ